MSNLVDYLQQVWLSRSNVWLAIGLLLGASGASLVWRFLISRMLERLASISGIEGARRLKFNDLLSILLLRHLRAGVSLKTNVGHPDDAGPVPQEVLNLKLQPEASGVTEGLLANAINGRTADTAVLISRLAELRERCGATVAVIAFQDESAAARTLVTPEHSLLRREFERFVRVHLTAGLELDWGFSDAALDQRIFGNFSGLGFRYGILIRARAPYGRAVVWLGYAERNFPADGALALARRLTEDFCSRWESSHEVAQYKTRAKIAEESVVKKADDLAHISHDMKSPLHNIKAVLHVLRTENDDKERQELFDVALSNCEDLANRIEDVLDLTRHRSGQLRAERNKVDIGELAQRVVRNFTHQARLKGLMLEIKDRPGLIVLGDGRQLGRVLANLVGNAVKYTEHGGVSVEIECIETCVSISVKDSGPGLSAEQCQQLFKPFTRFHTQANPGTGLGLALTRILLELNGGCVSVQSEPGKGSIFKVELPLHASHAPAVAGPWMSLHGKRVLVVDDDAWSVQSTIKVLERSGLIGLGAVTISQAESVLNYSNVDVVLCDTHMPDGGVVELAGRMHQHAWTQPLIAMSGDVRPTTVNRACASLLKPVAPDVLIAAIAQACVGELGPSGAAAL
ncbi:MAG: hybrid sensor histidine kinase/response regulator [Oligoflexia bacterium]|nr:hybrid sensor histidine kinase/response regulator [Oligoflexia bacterium]